jgi:FkbM family methyltransferase
MKKYKDIYDACNKLTSNKRLNVIVDLGARHGEGYEKFGINHPNSQFYFIEPSPRCLPHINKIIKKHGNNLHVIDGVLGEKDKTIQFYQLHNDDDQSGNLFSDRKKQYGPAKIIDVKMYDFKNIFKNIDFLKINIEGAEYSLIEQGFFNLVDSFVMEVHNAHVPNKNYNDVLASLSTHFHLEIWGDTSYKYCFINGVRKNG